MIDLAVLEFVKEWGEIGFLAVAVISLWRKTENQEKHIAKLVERQSEMLKDTVKHIERNSILLERLEKHGGN